MVKSGKWPKQDALCERIRGALAEFQDLREVNMFGGRAFMVDSAMLVSAGGRTVVSRFQVDRTCLSVAACR